MTILEAAAALRARGLSSVELVAASIECIRQHDAALRAFITTTPERAFARARQADSELAQGHDRGPLHGVPIAVKDLFLTAGVRTTAGSRIYDDYVPACDAAVVQRLESAGAVIVGKTNMHECAYGITSANPHYGSVRNPWNREHSPGGSSGGSGAAIAAGMVPGAMGSDTGGSIRIPAAFCGTVGLKPTYGRVSRFGALPLGYSLDHMGPMTRSVRDAAAMLNVIAGHDRRDETTSRRPVPDYIPKEDCSIRGLAIGVPENFYFDRLDPEVDGAVRAAIRRAESLGAELKPVRVPDMEAVNAVARVILLAEASAVWEPHLGRREMFGADVLALLDQGRFVPAPDYVNAQRLRRRLAAEFNRLWDAVDCLLVPTTANLAPKIGQTTVRLGQYEEDVRLATTRLLRGINLLGLPALSIPCAVSTTGLPIGLQIVGAPFEEELVLRIGVALEDAGVTIPCPSV